MATNPNTLALDMALAMTLVAQASRAEPELVLEALEIACRYARSNFQRLQPSLVAFTDQPRRD